MPTEKSIMQEARNLARLQNKRRKLRADLRRVDADIRLQKRHLRAVISARDDHWHESGAKFTTVGNQPGE